MNILLFFHSDERIPFAIHVCDEYTIDEDWTGVSLKWGDSVSTVYDYDYFLEFNTKDGWDEKKQVELLEQFTTDIEGIK